ncbi:Uncharacterised protein [Yersinia pseudotuberculosis]|nr:Uncharacterised protein [Yersinia pseudotuberculosis]
MPNALGKAPRKAEPKIHPVLESLVALALSSIREGYTATIIIIRVARSIEEYFAEMGDLPPLTE